MYIFVPKIKYSWFTIFPCSLILAISFLASSFSWHPGNGSLTVNCLVLAFTTIKDSICFPPWPSVAFFLVLPMPNM